MSDHPRVTGGVVKAHVQEFLRRNPELVMQRLDTETGKVASLVDQGVLSAYLDGFRDGADFVVEELLKEGL